MSDCKGSAREGGASRQFKGVENFLKRIAFNLGNTPSQTEVKIISCIPIDVSDLQQKILNLEKQLDEKYGTDTKVSNVICQCSKVMKKRSKNMGQCKCSAQGLSHTGVCCNTLDVDQGTNPTECGKCSKNNRAKSNVSFVDTSYAEFGFQPQSRKCSYDAHFVEILPYESATFLPSDTKYKNRNTYLRKKKKFNNNMKPNSHYVCYAQTDTNPFNKSKAVIDNSDKLTTRTYLAEVISKQFKPRSLCGISSGISKFSSPVCRDIHTENKNSILESDLSSCYYKTFQNIDNEIVKLNQVYKTNQIDTGGYYDSTLYDVIPVKEKVVKIKKTSCDIPRKRESKTPSPEHTKFETYRTSNPLKYVHYYTMTPSSNNYTKKNPKVNRRELPAKNIIKRKLETHNAGKRIKKDTTNNNLIASDNIYTKLNVNTPRTDKNVKSASTKQKLDAECLTKSIINSECQTIISEPHTEKTEITLNQIKNILQSVLHEVKVTTFTKDNIDEKPKEDVVVQKEEFHDNGQLNMPNNLPADQPTTMQNDLQRDTRTNSPVREQNNHPLNNFLDNIQKNYANSVNNSIFDNAQDKYPDQKINNLHGGFKPNQPIFNVSHNAYNPYLINHCLPFYSKPFHSGQSYCHPNVSTSKCFHNYPVFFPPPARHMCPGCFQQGPIPNVPNEVFPKQANTAATNTDKGREDNSTETERLIKEIYKTMALNMGVVHIDKNALHEYKPVYDFSKHQNKHKENVMIQPIKEGKTVTHVVHAVSELFRKKDLVSSETPNTTTESKTKFNEEKNRFKGISSSTEDFRRERLENFLSDVKPVQYKIDKPVFFVQKALETTLTESVSSSESDFDIMFIPQQHTQKDKKEKKSLLNKMFNTVKLFKSRYNKKQDNNDNDDSANKESTSDSDDYQTIYSQKTRVVPKQMPNVQHIPKRKTHSILSYKQVIQKEKCPEKLVRKLPYMEQEYRRYWNEKLMFDDNKCEYSSDVQFSGDVPHTSDYHQTLNNSTSFVKSKTKHKTEQINARQEKQDKKQTPKIDPKRICKGISLFKGRKISTHGIT